MSLEIRILNTGVRTKVIQVKDIQKRLVDLSKDMMDDGEYLVASDALSMVHNLGGELKKQRDTIQMGIKDMFALSFMDCDLPEVPTVYMVLNDDIYVTAFSDKDCDF